MGWAAGVERMLLASAGAAHRAPRPSTSTSPTRATPHRVAAFRLAADARRAGFAARLELAGRSLKGQLKQADRAGARYVAILGDEGTSLKDMETGEQRTVEPDTVMHFLRAGAGEAAPRQRLPRRLVRRAVGRARGGDRARRGLGAPPARPRRPDLRRPARPLRHRPARLPPRVGRRGARARPAAARGVRRLGRGHGGAPRGGQRQPEPRPRARSSSTCARPSSSPSRPRRRSRSTRTAPVDETLRLRHRVLDLRRGRHARRDAAAPHGRARDPRLPQHARLRRGGDADPHALHAGGRARLPRPQPHAARATSTRSPSRRSSSSSS